jgi:hypothetical protein
VENFLDEKPATFDIKESLDKLKTQLGETKQEETNQG